MWAASLSIKLGKNVSTLNSIDIAAANDTKSQHGIEGNFYFSRHFDVQQEFDWKYRKCVDMWELPVKLEVEPSEYLVPHQGCDVAGLPSGCSAHIQDTFSRTRSEHVTRNDRGKILRMKNSFGKPTEVLW